MFYFKQFRLANKKVPFQIVQFSISTQLNEVRSFNVKTVLFQAIQFSI